MDTKGTRRSPEREVQHEARSSRRRQQSEVRTAPRIPVLAIVLAIAALAIIIFMGRMCSQAASIDVTVNGTQHTLRGDKTMQTAINTSGWPVNPGDLISLGGTVLKRSAGAPFNAVVNGTETADPNFQLHNGDEITLTDGKDIVEDYDAYEEAIPYGMRITSLGCIHTFVDGSEGVKEIRTGRVSGEVVEKQTVDPTDAHENRYDPNPGDEKVIALTFDDGPSLEYTRDILKILEDNDAKATFFFRGDRVKDKCAEIAYEAYEQGHQICTHSYDNASKSGGDMASLTYDDQRAQIQDGYDALAEAIGQEPSHWVRMGGTDMPESVAINVFDLVDGEVGWTLDTGDWIYMPEDDIYDVLMSAKPGSIIRMHDAGDYQDATVAALKRALPKLAKQGYSFITVDEMRQY